MKLERQMVKDVIHDFFKRSEAIKAIGGRRENPRRLG